MQRCFIHIILDTLLLINYIKLLMEIILYFFIVENEKGKSCNDFCSSDYFDTHDLIFKNDL
jgi:hypothetical protein